MALTPRTFASQAKTLAGDQAVDAMFNVEVAPAFRGFRTLAELGATAIKDAGVETLAVLVWGYSAHADTRGVPMIMAWSATEPAHEGKKRSADGGWWELVSDEFSPLFFGCRWNGTTDDGANLNACMAAARAKGRKVVLPAGVAYCGETIYIGNLSVVGAGAPQNAANDNHSKTVLLSRANPMIAGSIDAVTHAGQLTSMRDVCALSALALGELPAPINLYDYNAYPYQVGVWLGRPHGLIPSTATDESSTWGSGSVFIERVTVQGASGWAFVGHRMWGKSVVQNYRITCCGGVGAAGLGDDRLAGGIKITGNSVDFHFRDGHHFNWNYHSIISGVAEAADELYSGRGTGLQVGEIKSVLDALGREFRRGGNQRFSDLQLEHYAHPVDLRASVSMIQRNMVWSGAVSHGHGGTAILGEPSNPAGTFRLETDSIKMFNMDTIELKAGMDTIKLNNLFNEQPGNVVTLKYRNGFSIDSWSAGSSTAGGNNSHGIELEPDFTDDGLSASSLSSFVPYVITDLHPAGADANMLPAFRDSAGALPATSASRWINESLGVGSSHAYANSKSQVSIRDGGIAAIDVAGVSPGDLLTLQFWVFLGENFSLDNLTYGLKDTSGSVLFARQFGLGSQSGGDRFYPGRINFKVPEGLSAVRPFFAAQGGLNATIYTPILTKGLARPIGDERPKWWPTPEEYVAAA